MKDIRERYDISDMRIQPGRDYRELYLGDLATRIVKSHQDYDGKTAEPIQTDYDRLAQPDRRRVDEYIEAYKEEQ